MPVQSSMSRRPQTSTSSSASAHPGREELGDKSADIQSSLLNRPETLTRSSASAHADMEEPRDKSTEVPSSSSYSPQTSTSSSPSAHPGREELGDESADLQLSLSYHPQTSTSSSTSAHLCVEGFGSKYTYNEGLNGMPIHNMVDFPYFDQVIKSQTDKISAGLTTKQFVVFRGVTEKMFAYIDNERRDIGGNMRFHYDSDCEELIVKLMPTFQHEAAHCGFSHELTYRARDMGLSWGSLIPCGATRYRGCSNSSSKEGDSAHKPRALRPSPSDWPTIVFESGFSESLPRLRVAAAWWLMESGGHVKIVVIIAVQLAQGRIVIEKWGLSAGNFQRPPTRAVPNPAVILVPNKLQEITILRQASPPRPAIVTGAPLILEFVKIFLRAPLLPETDFVFTDSDLSDCAEWILG